MAKDNAPDRAWSGLALQLFALARDPFQWVLAHDFGGHGSRGPDRVPFSSIVSWFLSGIDLGGFLSQPGTCPRGAGTYVFSVAHTIKPGFSIGGQGSAANPQTSVRNDVLAPGERNEPAGSPVLNRFIKPRASAYQTASVLRARRWALVWLTNFSTTSDPRRCGRGPTGAPIPSLRQTVKAKTGPFQ